MDSIDSDDSNPHCFEIRINDRSKVSTSQVTRKRDDDDEEDVSDKEAKLIRRKKPKMTTTTTLVSSSTASKITWTKNDELRILRGIVDYEDEKKLRYRSDWDAFYGYVKGSIESNFSKVQLSSKVRKLKKRFTDNLAKSDDGKGPSFANTDDDAIFKLSMIIWGKKNEKEVGSNENLDQGKDVTSVENDEQINEDVEKPEEDATDVEYEQINENVEQAMEDATDVEHEQVNENVEKAEDVNHVTVVENEQINGNVGQAKNVRASNMSTKADNGEKEKKVDNGEKEKKSETAGVDEFGVLQDALEATLLSFPSLGRNHQKFMLQNLRNLEAEKGKELSDEWKALLGEEMKLNIKKLNFSAKLADAAGSD